MTLWLLKDDHSLPAYNYKELVASLYAQCFSSFARDHNLVLRSESCLRHHFTPYSEADPVGDEAAVLSVGFDVMTLSGFRAIMVP